jgi:hypothetical protein
MGYYMASMYASHSAFSALRCLVGITDIRFKRVNSSIKILAMQEMHTKFAMERHTLLI